MAASTDEELIRKALSGDEAAWRTLRDRLLPIINATIRTFGQTRGLARLGYDEKDLWQEVLLHLIKRDYHALRRYTAAEGSLAAYVRTVVRNRLRDLTRMRDAKAELVPLDESAEPLAPAPSPEALVLTRERLMTVRTAVLTELPPKGQVIFQYLFVDEVPDKEVAVILNVSPQVIANWKHKIRRLARKRLADDEKLPGPSS